MNYLIGRRGPDSFGILSYINHSGDFITKTFAAGKYAMPLSRPIIRHHIADQDAAALHAKWLPDQVSSDVPGAYLFGDPLGDKQHQTLYFQSEPGDHGLTNEALLAIVLDRLERFQGVLPCDENSVAIGYLLLALDALKSRTKDRIARGVEGTDHP